METENNNMSGNCEQLSGIKARLLQLQQNDIYLNNNNLNNISM